LRELRPTRRRGKRLLTAAIAEVDDALRPFEHALVGGPIAHHHGPDAGLLFQPVHEERATREILVRHCLAARAAGEEDDLGQARFRRIDLQRHARLIVGRLGGERKAGQ
jgi:hypothetical protein